MEIKKLSDLISSKISAGEIIDRPCYILKELLENSFDAGSTKISIYLDFPVNNLIKVVDNGVGIFKEDLYLSILNRTTSKIYTLSDLSRIKTYGFRGEALFAISSISDFILMSRAFNQELGWKISVNNLSNKLKVDPVFHGVGTTVIVKNIFDNYYVKKIYLKSDRFEFNYLLKLFRLLVLSRMDINFKLFLPNNKVRYYPLCDGTFSIFNRFKSLFGVNYSNKFKYFDISNNDIRIYGFIPSIKYSNFSLNNKCIFLNKRIIVNDLIDSTIKNVYRDIGHLNIKPDYYLFLDIDASCYDINLSPKKNIVNFKNYDYICKFIYNSLIKFLNVKSSLYSINRKKIDVENFNKSLFFEKCSSDYFSLSNKKNI